MYRYIYIDVGLCGFIGVDIDIWVLISGLIYIYINMYRDISL